MVKDFRFLEGTSWRGWVSEIPEQPLPPKAQYFTLENQETGTQKSQLLFKTSPNFKQNPDINNSILET